MLEVMKNVNGVYEISASAQMFVVPNNARRIEAFSESTKNHIIQNCGLNDITLEGNEKFVEVWIVSKDLHTTNLGDHGCRVNIAEGEILIIDSGIPCYIPSKVFEGKKEGDFINWAVTGEGWVRAGESGKEITNKLNLCIELNQRDFRYRRFGQFEEVVKAVTV